MEGSNMTVMVTPKGFMTSEGEFLDLTTIEDAAWVLRELRSQRSRLTDMIKDLEVFVAERMDEQGVRAQTVSNEGRTTAIEVGPPDPMRLKGWDEDILGRLLLEEPKLPTATFNELVTYGMVKVDARVANRIANTKPEWKAIIDEARLMEPAHRKVAVS